MTTLSKDNILENLLTEGHITIKMADLILNNKYGRTEIIEELAHDCIITKGQAIILLKENESFNFPTYIPDTTPIIQPYMDWRPSTGTIVINPYTITSTHPVKSTDSSALNKNFTDK